MVCDTAGSVCIALCLHLHYRLAARYKDDVRDSRRFLRHTHIHICVACIRTNGRLSRRLWEIDDRHGFARDTIEEWKPAKIDVCIYMMRAFGLGSRMNLIRDL